MRQVCDLFQAIPVNRKVLEFVSVELIQSTIRAALSPNEAEQAAICKIGVGGEFDIQVAVVCKVTNEPPREMVGKRAVAIRNAVCAAAMALIEGDLVMCVSRWFGSPPFGLYRVSYRRFRPRH